MDGINIQLEDRVVFDRLKSTGKINNKLRRLITQQWNKCSSCNARISDGRPIFAGYDAADLPLFVGVCCADKLKELATPVYAAKDLDISISDRQSVWRYMDFAKYVSMLSQGGLYFSRIETLEDRFEGAVGLASRQTVWDNFYLNFFRKAITTPPPGYPLPEFSEAHVQSEAERLLLDFKTLSEKVRRNFVNCWHANDIESEALWRLYCPPPTTGVAILSNVGKLWDAISADNKAIVGRIHYVYFKEAFTPHGRDRIFCKRLSLNHEREVRVVLDGEDDDINKGRILSCNLNELVSSVIVSPFASPWFFNVVKETTQKFGFSFNITQSELLNEPFY